jgi:peptide/nickel transport system permease protein
VGRYVLHRLLQAIPLMIGISIVVFLLIRASGDPLAFYQNDPRMSAEDVARLEERLGVNQPVHVQYLAWIGNVVRGDLGTSFVTGQPVATMVGDRLPNSLILMGTGFILAILIAVPLGIFSAVRRYSLGDYVVTAFSFIGYATPAFWLGLLLILLFAVKFREWGLPGLPPGGMYDLREGPSLGGLLLHLILPAGIIALIYSAPLVRYLRGSLLDVLRQDYLRTAHAKGLSSRTVLYRHALKNAGIPVATVIMAQIPYLLGGTMVLEQVFSWPGMGRLFWESAVRVDYPVMMGILLLVSGLVVIMNIVADLVYAWLDPRIRFA